MNLWGRTEGIVSEYRVTHSSFCSWCLRATDQSLEIIIIEGISLLMVSVPLSHPTTLHKSAISSSIEDRVSLEAVVLAEGVCAVSNLFWSQTIFPALILEMKWKMGMMRGQPSAVGTHCSLAVHLGPCSTRKTHARIHMHAPQLEVSPTERKKGCSLTMGYWTLQIALCSCSYRMIAAPGPYLAYPAWASNIFSLNPAWDFNFKELLSADYS